MADLKRFTIQVPQVPGLWIEVSLEEGGERGSLSWELETGAGDSETVIRTWLCPDSVKFLKEQFGVK
jgi:hypothetical protein